MTQTNTAERKTLSVRPANSRKLLARKAAEQAPETAMNQGDALEASFPGGPELIADETAAAPADAVPNDVYIEPAGDDAAAAVAPVAALPDDAVVLGDAIDQPGVGAAGQPVVAAVPPVQAEPAAEPESAPSNAGAPAPTALHPTAPSWSPEDESTLNAMMARRKAAGYQRRGRDVSGQVIRLGDVKPNPDTVIAVIVGLVAAAGGGIGRAELIERMAAAKFPNAKAQPGDKGWCGGYVAGACRAGALVVANAGEDRAKTQSGNDAQVAA